MKLGLFGLLELHLKVSDLSLSQNHLADDLVCKNMLDPRTCQDLPFRQQLGTHHNRFNLHFLA